jgi:hypothetical protein
VVEVLEVTTCRECGKTKPLKGKCDRKCDLMTRSCRIISKGGEFYLKGADGWYLGAHTNIAAGPDKADWSKRDRLPFHNLEWAFAIAPLYDCKVVVIYRKKRK